MRIPKDSGIVSVEIMSSPTPLIAIRPCEVWFMTARAHQVSGIRRSGPCFSKTLNWFRVKSTLLLTNYKHLNTLRPSPAKTTVSLHSQRDQKCPQYSGKVMENSISLQRWANFALAFIMYIAYIVYSNKHIGFQYRTVYVFTHDNKCCFFSPECPLDLVTRIRVCAFPRGDLNPVTKQASGTHTPEWLLMDKILTELQKKF